VKLFGICDGDYYYIWRCNVFVGYVVVKYEFLMAKTRLDKTIGLGSGHPIVDRVSLVFEIGW